MLQAFTGLGIEIIRLPAMFSALLKYLFTSNLTPRDRNYQYMFGSVRSMGNPGWFPFAKIYAQVGKAVGCAVGLSWTRSPWCRIIQSR